MTQSLTGELTRDLPHSKPPLGYRRGGLKILFYKLNWVSIISLQILPHFCQELMKAFLSFECPYFKFTGEIYRMTNTFKQ